MNWDVFLDSHFDEYDAMLEHIRGWDLDFTQLKPGKSPIELAQFGRQDLLITKFDFAQAYDQCGSAANNAITLAVLEEDIEEVVCPTGIFDQDGLVIFPSGCDISAISKSRFAGYTITISEELFESMLQISGIADIHAGRMHNQNTIHCGSENMRKIRNVLRHLCRELPSLSGARGAHSLPELEFEMIGQLLGAMNTSRETSRLKLSAKKKAVIQRSLDYIEANAKQPVTVLKLAEAAEVSVRTVEQAFQDFFGVTPKAYLKARRLNAVRRALLNCENNASSITEIAGQWNFWHMGQFSADYKRFFMELPSTTLKKRANHK